MERQEIKYFCEELCKKEREIAYAVQFLHNIIAMLRDGKYKPAILEQIDGDSDIALACDFVWHEIERWHVKHTEKPI